MRKIIPVFYSEYGRYISRFRAIPLYVDALKPVERRLLLSLHEVAKNKLVKSAKVIGHVIGSYHPHGDQSAYGTLVDMVRRGLVLGEGNFGTEGLE
ncbi:MAG: DNA gyrase subunit A, partial [Melioribacteraceae bacterium]|nr:DNA gyrase subunit A [Melioribacteraceae bacterium]